MRLFFEFLLFVLLRKSNVKMVNLFSISCWLFTVRDEEDDFADSENIENLDLKPCPTCSRTFLEPALLKHIGICEKTNFHKRTPFDSFRQRREGTELATYLPSDYGIVKQRSPSLHRDQPSRTTSKMVRPNGLVLLK